MAARNTALANGERSVSVGDRSLVSSRSDGDCCFCFSSQPANFPADELTGTARPYHLIVAAPASEASRSDGRVGAILAGARK